MHGNVLSAGASLTTHWQVNTRRAPWYPQLTESAKYPLTLARQSYHGSMECLLKQNHPISYSSPRQLDAASVLVPCILSRHHGMANNSLICAHVMAAADARDTLPACQSRLSELPRSIPDVKDLTERVRRHCWWALKWSQLQLLQQFNDDTATTRAK